jgi:hypothetical protein
MNTTLNEEKLNKAVQDRVKKDIDATFDTFTLEQMKEMDYIGEKLALVAFDDILNVNKRINFEEAFSSCSDNEKTLFLREYVYFQVYLIVKKIMLLLNNQEAADYIKMAFYSFLQKIYETQIKPEIEYVSEEYFKRYVAYDKFYNSREARDASSEELFRGIFEMICVFANKDSSMVTAQMMDYTFRSFAVSFQKINELIGCAKKAFPTHKDNLKTIFLWLCLIMIVGAVLVVMKKF